MKDKRYTFACAIWLIFMAIGLAIMTCSAIIIQISNESTLTEYARLLVLCLFVYGKLQVYIGILGYYFCKCRYEDYKAYKLLTEEIAHLRNELDTLKSQTPERP